MYERLFLTSNPSGEDGETDIMENLNPNSLKVLKNCVVEKDLEDATAGTTYQFMRNGYFTIDTKSTKDNLIFNLTVTLKDSFNK